ncbi:MAG TPA: indole-3-glycerol phosphate synthase TrpC [Acidimicrobiales bacterium]|nr:indole-3-glycerol phosphate synthase TrpC [Acidimicrobiales bacterium]
MASYLDEIVAFHRHRAATSSAPSEVAEKRARDRGRPRGWAAALRADGVSVIAEIKRRSPSKGALAPDLDPAALARDYQRGGAACLSVLTDENYFGGSEADLAAARSAVPLPVLRKDFTVSAEDVFAARAMGADAYLLIVAALSPVELRRFLDVGAELGMDALVEVHDEAELDLALAAGADVIGVNQRDLRTFEVDTERAERLLASIPEGIVRVAESGIGDRAAVERLEAAGADAILVGESLVRSPDPAAALAALLGRDLEVGTVDDRGQRACS